MDSVSNKNSGCLLDVQNLKTYYYGNSSFIRSVDGVSFSLGRNETLGIAGESGSGKTQTALSIMGLNSGAPGIIDGEIWFNSFNILENLNEYCNITKNNGTLIIEKDFHDWAKLHESRLKNIRGEKFAMIFQEPKSSLSPYFSIEEHFRETIAARYGKQQSKSYKDLVIPMLKKLLFKSPDNILANYPHHLSGGESQRIMIALALLGNPELLIADEPTTLLDSVIQYCVIELIDTIIKENKLSLLFITHNLAILKRLVNNVVIMFSGKIVEQGPTSIVLNKNEHHHKYTELLLDAADENGDYKLPPELETKKNHQGCRYYYRCSRKDKLSADQKKKCKTEEPILTKINNNHSIACWILE